MTETKKRTIAEIQQQYQDLCLKAGHLQYQVYTLSRDVEMVNAELRDLNLEAAGLKAAEEKAAAETAAAAKAAEATPTVDVPNPSAPFEAAPATLTAARNKRNKTANGKEATK